MTEAHQDPLNLRRLFEPVVGSMGFELVGVECTGLGHSGLVRVYLDKKDGITADDCRKVSYQLSGLLDVEDPVPGEYTLEVSSPGLDRLLFQARDFERFVNEMVRIQLDVPRDGRRKFKGVLKGMRGSDVVIEVDGEEQVVALQNIL